MTLKIDIIEDHFSIETISAEAKREQSVLKSAREAIHKSKDLNGDVDRLPEVLKVPPISQRGNVNEIIGKCGGADQLRNAVNQLQALLYMA